MVVRLLTISNKKMQARNKDPKNIIRLFTPASSSLKLGISSFSV